MSRPPSSPLPFQPGFSYYGHPLNRDASRKSMLANSSVAASRGGGRVMSMRRLTMDLSAASLGRSSSTGALRVSRGGSGSSGSSAGGGLPRLGISSSLRSLATIDTTEGKGNARAHVATQSPLHAVTLGWGEGGTHARTHAHIAPLAHARGASP